MRWFWRRQRPEVVTYLDPTDHRFRLFGQRRYLAGVPYDLPKDLQEVNRLDFQHYMLRYALRGNFVAPIGQPLSILDVGCGSGRWPLEMAAQFPAANVIGVDLIPPPVDENSQPGVDLRPPNYAFVPGNVLEGLPFGPTSFDFVHQRLLIGALPTAQWPDVVRELHRVARPGGWVELVEADIRVEYGGRALDSLSDWIYATVARRGIDPSQSRQIGRWLGEAGLGLVQQREIHLRLGRQYGRLGQMMEINHLALYEALKGPILASGATSEDSFDRTMQAARGEIAHGRCSVAFFVAYGQRVQMDTRTNR